MTLQVIIPSRGRYDCSRTLRLFEHVSLCVGEDEAPRYQAANPGAELLVHPAEVLGMGRKRQWILEHLDPKAEGVFMVDDDVTACMCLVGQTQREITDRRDIAQIVENAASCAREAGTILFGFMYTADTRHFRAYHPISFTGYVNGFAMGILRPPPGQLHEAGVRFDPLLTTKQDIDFSLQVLLKYRILWKDNRFAFRSGGWFRNVGGMATVRTSATVAANIERLRAKWGEAVQIDHYERTGKGKHQNVKIRVVR